MLDPRSSDIALVGMACVFPGAPDLDAFFANLRAGADCVTDVPAARWDPVFYDPTSRAVDRFYCRRGGFVDDLASFDAARFGIMPVAVKGTEPDQLLTLAVAARALADAGYEERPLPRATTGVILGRGGYAGAGRTRLEQQVRTAEQLVSCLRGLVPGLSEAELARVKAEFQAQLGSPSADAAIGLVPNLAASRIAHRLDLHGPAFTVDAACASALVAVDQACRELASGRCDLVVAGGVHLCHDEAFWSVFCQLGALSRGQQIRPFDRRADGLLIGEGVGLVVLKRLADAERDHDRIYAVVRGAGVASDGRETSLMTPRVEGQLLALERAWAAAGLDPRAVGFVEAHGTGTPAGDAAELATLARFFGTAAAGERRAALGSVKAMIGHTMPAAGAAGLIKAALAIHHGVLFPQIHCEEPHPALAQTRFRMLAAEEPWPEGAPRRAAVNAFGFGGINAHVVLEAPPKAPARRRAAVEPSATRMALFAADSPEALLAAVDARHEQTRGGPARLAVLDPTPERLARAQDIVRKGRPYRGRDGISFSPRGLLAAGGTLVFLFPGVDSTFEPRVEDVARHFGLPVPAQTAAKDLEGMGVGIVGVNRLLDTVLRSLGVRPAMVAGHSIGEWSGMVSTGLIPEAALDAFLADVRPGTLEVPGVLFAAAGCGVERAEEAIAGLPGIALSHDNCPHQVILCGHEGPLDVALQRLRDNGVLCQVLPFRSGFHSPLFEPYLAPHRANFARFPLAKAREPLWSATTAAPYPDAVEDVRALCIEHLVRPVRFRETVDNLYARGARVFLQVGTGSLVNFVEDTLRGREHLALAANVKERTGLAQLRRAAAALFVEGASVDFGKLVPRDARSHPEPLALGVPLVRPRRPLQPSSVGAAASGGASASTLAPMPAEALAHPLAPAFAVAMQEAAQAHADVLSRLAAAKKPTAVTVVAVAEATPSSRSSSPSPSSPRLTGPRAVTSVRTLSVETLPEVLGHTFFRQPPGWSVVSDLHPVVPMTTAIDLMMEHAQALVPERVVVGMDDVRAFRWLAVATPIDAKITCAYDGHDRVKVTIADYCEGTAVLADAYSVAPPADDGALSSPLPAGISARELYDQRWMFHGPPFQGIVDVGVLADDGIRGELETGAARGALLDNAGQLFGYWVMARSTRNRLAMPVSIQKLRVFAPHPRPGERLTCTARIRHLDDRSVVADLSLDRGGRAWAHIEGWEDRRFDTDAALWDVLIWPEKHLLAAALDDGLVLFVDKYRAAPTRDQLARRFLGEDERRAYERKVPRRQRAWLSGRIAAKDAVRSLLRSLGRGPMFPVEVRLGDDDGPEPRVHAPDDLGVRVALAESGDTFVARASITGRPTVAIERIAPIADENLDAAELRLGVGEEPMAFRARVRAARAAAVQARGARERGADHRGASHGSPGALPRARDRAGEKLLVGGDWVTTLRHGDLVVAWMETGTST